jgi:mannose-6-phosphate isomerase-like protein (cupin superfamily)
MKLFTKFAQPQFQGAARASVDWRRIAVAGGSLLLLAALPILAGDPEGFQIWTSSEMQAHAKAAKLDQNKVAADRVANWGNHSALLVHREATGEVEVHDTQADVIFVVSGEGSMTVGGAILEARNTAAGETRGKPGAGGVTKKLAPGDVIHVPAKMTHIVIVPAGKQITYFTLKVDTK